MIEINNGGVATPLGFQSSGIFIDIKGNKEGEKDFGLLVSDVPCNVAAVFTKNKVKAAPLIYDIDLIAKHESFFGVVVNSGNANACTGKNGLKDAISVCNEVEKRLGLEKGSVLSASTGVIGERLPVEKMLSNVEKLVSELDDSDNDFAKAILTTDTKEKKCAVLIETESGSVVIGGVAKGAGMIAPDMATMLAFITTDALVEKDALNKALRYAVEDSFNSITVDGDMSTNDSVFLFANGMSGIEMSHGENFELFKKGLAYVCEQLAKMIVKDGEGATKFVTINVVNAKSFDDAKKCAFKIANSPLCKTMFFGCDPNWGRLMATVGASMIEMDEHKVDIYFNDIQYVKNGLLIDKTLEKKVYEIMKNEEYSITIDLNMGSNSKTVYTCDFSYDYVKINADYRT